MPISIKKTLEMFKTETIKNFDYTILSIHCMGGSNVEQPSGKCDLLCANISIIRNGMKKIRDYTFNMFIPDQTIYDKEYINKLNKFYFYDNVLKKTKYDGKLTKQQLEEDVAKDIAMIIDYTHDYFKNDNIFICSANNELYKSFFDKIISSSKSYKFNTRINKIPEPLKDFENQMSDRSMYYAYGKGEKYAKLKTIFEKDVMNIIDLVKALSTENIRKDIYQTICPVQKCNMIIIRKLMFEYYGYYNKNNFNPYPYKINDFIHENNTIDCFEYSPSQESYSLSYDLMNVLGLYKYQLLRDSMVHHSVDPPFPQISTVIPYNPYDAYDIVDYGMF